MARTPASSIVAMSWLTGWLSQSSLQVRKASPRWLWASMTGKRGCSTSCACVVSIGRGSYSRSVRSTVVSLEPTEGYSFYELPLEEEEDDEDRDGRHVRGGQQERRVGEVLPLKEGDPHREDLHLGAVRHDQCPEELVPRPEHDQEGEGGQRGPRQRQVDLPIDLERVRTFDGRRLLKVGRNGEEILTEEKGAERAEEEGHDQPLVRIEPAELPHQRVSGDDQHLFRHHQSRQENEEDRVAARETQPRKGECRHRGDEDLTGDAHYRDDDGVGIEAQERHRVE